MGEKRFCVHCDKDVEIIKAIRQGDEEQQELSCGHKGRRIYRELREGGKPKVFISYSHKDKGKVNPIASSLIRVGWEVWVDERQLLGGDQIVSELGKAISDADYYIVFLSKDSVKSPYVQYELTNALTLQISRNRPRVIPVKLDEFSVPTILASFNYIKMESAEQVFAAIVKTVEQTKFAISPSQLAIEPDEEIRMPSFSYFICEKTRNIDSFTHKELEEATELIKKNLRKKANQLLYHLLPVEDIKQNTSDIPYVSFHDEVKDRGSIDVDNKEICWQVEILNPDEDKIKNFISQPRENVNAIQYVFLLPSPKANLGNEIFKNIMKEYAGSIDEFDEEGVSYKDQGQKFVVSCTDDQITIKVESKLPLINNADIEKFNIRNIAKKLISGVC